MSFFSFLTGTHHEDRYSKITLRGSDIEEMDRDSDETDSNDSSTDDSSDDLDIGDISLLDEEECVRRRNVCVEQMTELEKQILALHEQIYKEKINHLELKLNEIKYGGAMEYTRPERDMEEQMNIRMDVATVLRNYKLKALHDICKADELSTKQNFDNTSKLLKSEMADEISHNMTRLDEERTNTDVAILETAMMKNWKYREGSRSFIKRYRESSLSPPRKRPVTISGPYIVYMLKDHEVLEDWRIIMRAMATARCRES